MKSNTTRTSGIAAEKTGENIKGTGGGVEKAGATVKKPDGERPE